MLGVVTRNESEVSWEEFDCAFFEVKDVTGRTAEPVPEAVGMVSCFGDNATAEAEPSLVPVDEAGRRATRDQPFFDWDYICPSQTGYREGLLEIVEDVGAVCGDVRLDDVGFPRWGYCHCDACTANFEASDHDDWSTWRAATITSFVEEATERIPGRSYLTLYPDPYPGHLHERAGLSLEALSGLVDEFVVPLYDMAYTTTYWLETIARGFETALEAPFSIELYAVDLDLENLIHATEVAAEYGEHVLFGYDASTARAAIRRMRAEDRPGRTHRR